MDALNNFQYDVFVSYSRKDFDFAQKLSQRIERYIPPKSTGLSKRRLQVFIDAKRLTASSDLAGNLKEKVLASKYLVLVCSPNTPGA